MKIAGFPLCSVDKNRRSERTRELKAKGYITYEANGLSGEINPAEKLFLQILEKRIRKHIKNFKAQGIRLKSFNIMFEK